MFTPAIDILLFGAFLIPPIGYIEQKTGMPRLKALYTTSLLLASLAFAFSLHNDAMRGILTVPKDPKPLAFSLGIDRLGILMAILAIFIGLMACIFSMEYMKKDASLTEYYTALALMVAGMMGVAFSADLLTFFIFWELMCLTSYALVAFRKETWEAVEAGFKYLLMSGAGSALLLMGFSLLYAIAGSLNLGALAIAIRQASLIDKPWLLVIFALLLVGFGIKAAIAPFHTWLPDAHPAAPSPISALLSGVMIKMGVYGLMRLSILLFLPIVSTWQGWLMVLSIITMFIGNLSALLQSDIKRLLAFSSIAQIGYILFGLALGTLEGITGSLFHIVNHALMKGLLFLSAGAFFHSTGTRDLKLLEGVGRRMPITGMTFALGALAIAGLPSLNGFMSELYLINAGIQAGQVLGIALMIINIVISVAYYLRIIQIILLRRPTESLQKVHEAPLSMVAPMVLLSILCVIIGIYPEPILEESRAAASSLLDWMLYAKAFVP
ncbi:MAG: NADH-quinone oxidoreductase subunit M [Candidatus Bathyarchaeia archaeon]